MRGAFIGNSKAPTAGAGSLALRISAVSNRTCTCNDDHAGSRAEGRGHRDLHVTDNLYFSGNYFCHDLAYRSHNLWTPSARDSNAGTLHLLRINSYRPARRKNRLAQSFSRACFTNARDVARSSRGHSQKRGLVAHSARCLAPPAVNAEIVGHGIVLSQGSLVSASADPERDVHKAC